MRTASGSGRPSVPTSAAQFQKANHLAQEKKATPAAKVPTLVDQQLGFLEQKRLSRKPDGFKLDKETLSSYEKLIPDFLLVAQKRFAKEVDGMDLRRWMEAPRGQRISTEDHL